MLPATSANYEHFLACAAAHARSLYPLVCAAPTQRCARLACSILGAQVDYRPQARAAVVRAPEFSKDTTVTKLAEQGSPPYFKERSLITLFTSIVILDEFISGAKTAFTNKRIVRHDLSGDTFFLLAQRVQTPCLHPVSQ